MDSLVINVLFALNELYEFLFVCSCLKRSGAWWITRRPDDAIQIVIPRFTKQQGFGSQQELSRHLLEFSVAMLMHASCCCSPVFSWLPRIASRSRDDVPSTHGPGNSSVLCLASGCLQLWKLIGEVAVSIIDALIDILIVYLILRLAAQDCVGSVSGRRAGVRLGGRKSIGARVRNGIDMLVWSLVGLATVVNLGKNVGHPRISFAPFSRIIPRPLAPNGLEISCHRGHIN